MKAVKRGTISIAEDVHEKSDEGSLTIVTTAEGVVSHSRRITGTI